MHALIDPRPETIRHSAIKLSVIVVLKYIMRDGHLISHYHVGQGFSSGHTY